MNFKDEIQGQSHLVPFDFRQAAPIIADDIAVSWELCGVFPKKHSVSLEQQTNVVVGVFAQPFYFDATRLAGRFGAGILARI